MKKEINKDKGYRLHFNLHKERITVSVYYKKIGWRVLKHVDYLQAFYINFKVSQKSRLKVLNDKSRNVHAYAYCKEINFKQLNKDFKNVVSYNPYKYGYFYKLKDGEPIYNLHNAFFNGNKIMY